MTRRKDFSSRRLRQTADPVFSLLAIALTACVAQGQPTTFVENFDGPTLDPAWTLDGDLAGHPLTIAGTYDITDAHGSPGVKILRSTSTPGTLTAFTHEIDVVLDPHLLSGAGGTLTDFKWKSAGPDGLIEIVYNTFGHLRVNHNDFNGNSGHIAGGSPDNIELENYEDGDALKLTVDYDPGPDTIDVSYSVNGGLPVNVYSGGGIIGPLGDVITSFVEVELFKFGITEPTQTIASIDSWSLSASGVPCVPGDTDGDGDVDLLDLDALGANFGTLSGATKSEGDFDGDGDVDLLDLDILGANFGTGVPSASVPEPTALALAFTAALCAATRHAATRRLG